MKKTLLLIILINFFSLSAQAPTLVQPTVPVRAVETACEKHSVTLKTQSAPVAGREHQADALQQKIEQFKQDNPHTLKILLAYLRNTEEHNEHTVFLYGMKIARHRVAEGSNAVLTTEIIYEQPRMLDGDKEATTLNSLRDSIEKMAIDLGSYQKLDNCTRCATFHNRALDILNHRCTTYIPAEIFAAMKRQKQQHTLE